jgi:hypothetical protein
MKTNGRMRNAIFLRTRSCRDGVGGALCIKRCVSALLWIEVQFLCPPWQGGRRAFCGRGLPYCLRPPMVPFSRGTKTRNPLRVTGLHKTRLNITCCVCISSYHPQLRPAARAGAKLASRAFRRWSELRRNKAQASLRTPNLSAKARCTAPLESHRQLRCSTPGFGFFRSPTFRSSA